MHMCVVMCTDMCMDMCIDMCMDLCMDMCMDMCMDLEIVSPEEAQQHALSRFALVGSTMF